MNPLLRALEEKHASELMSGKNFPAFRPGDTLQVHVRITEVIQDKKKKDAKNKGPEVKTRIQMFEGVCIAIRRASVRTSFVLRRIAHGDSVERIFPLYSPIIEKIDVKRMGQVRRAKLYYLRHAVGKKQTRIAERFEKKIKA